MIAIVLAGGVAARLGGGDKGLIAVGGAAILDRIVATMRAQCEDILISANGDAARFARFGCEVVPDDAPTRRGPLAGVLAGLDAVAARDPGAPLAVTVPTDTPVPSRRPRRAAAARPGGGGAARRRALRWPPASDRRPVDRRAAPRPAPRARPRGPAAGAALLRATPVRSGRLARDAVRPVLQRQHGRRPRARGDHRARRPTSACR